VYTDDGWKGQTFLVVDDHAPNARSWCRQLTSLGGRALTAQSVLEGRRLIDEVEAIDGAVLDLMLPDGRGLELIAPLRERFPNAPVAIVTGADVEERFANDVLAQGALYGRKPLGFEGLMALFDRARLASAASATTRSKLDAFVDGFGLSRAERDALMAQLATDTRAEAAHLLGVKSDTVKSHTRAVLRKSGYRSLRGLMRAMLEHMHQAPA
jgi:DNA-binding response OmpR family regulator